MDRAIRYLSFIGDVFFSFFFHRIIRTKVFAENDDKTDAFQDTFSDVLKINATHRRETIAVGQYGSFLSV